MQTQKFLSRENLLATKVWKIDVTHLVKRQKHNISQNARANIFQITNNSGI